MCVVLVVMTFFDGVDFLTTVVVEAGLVCLGVLANTALPQSAAITQMAMIEVFMCLEWFCLTSSISGELGA